MNLEPGIIARIATGDADACRIAADWLLERGDERGEFILDELAVEARPNPATRAAAKKRRAAWERTHFGAWASPVLALGATGYELRRGFIDLVRLHEHALDALPKMLELEPITRLRVTLADGAALARAMRHPSFARIRELDLAGAAPKLDVPAPGIATLVLRSIADSTLDSLPSSFPALETLGVAFTQAGDAALSAVASGRLKLQRLWAANASVGDASLGALASSSTALRELDLSSNRFDRSLRRLGENSSLTALHTLKLQSVYAARGFLSREGLPALRKLRVTHPTSNDRQVYAARGISLF